MRARRRDELPALPATVALGRGALPRVRVRSGVAGLLMREARRAHVDRKDQPRRPLRDSRTDLADGPSQAGG
jgi:hypothetical protein